LLKILIVLVSCNCFCMLIFPSFIICPSWSDRPVQVLRPNL